MKTGSRKMRVMLTAALSLIVAVAMSSAVFAEADVRSEVLPDGAAYIDENGNTKILARDQFRIVGLDTDEDPGEFENGWYVLYGGGAVIKRIEIKGDVKLLLMNGFTTDFKNGIHVPKGSSLSIYGQSTDRDTSGVLIATGEKGAAGIGSNITPSIDKPDDCGIINVYGGVIRAEGGEGGAGIGGGYGLIKYDVEYGGDGGTYYQKYGWVEAVGGKSAAGVGGGRRGDSGTVTIDGGTLEATGGEAGAGIGGGEALVNSSNFNSGGNSTFITINGGVVRAFGSGGGAGIGAGKGANGTKGGYDDPMDKRGCIKITGGNVTAFGSEGGAGIGGALNDINDWYEFAAGANVDISGGYVNAKGGAEAAGIGSARSKAEGSGYTRIHGNAEVRAQGGDYAAGIGTGNEPHKLAVNGVWPKLYDIKIYESAKVYATGGKEAAGIGCGNEGQRSAGAAGKLEISDNAEVTAQGGKYGAGIGGGDQNVNGTVNIKGGTVNATGGYGGAGIGGGDDADDDSSAGDINISGGTVNANGGDYGAGIGAGDTSDMKCKLEITGGKVTATAGKEAAGIGGGNSTYFGGGGKGGTVKIALPKAAGSDDYVLALSGEGAAPIGHGQDADDSGKLELGERTSVKSSTVKQDYEGVKDTIPDTFSERYEVCKSDKVRTLLVQNCAHPNMKYTYVDEKKHLARCPSCGKSDEEGHIGGIDEACRKCNYRGEYWRVTLKEGKDADHTRELRVGKGLTTTFPEHLDKYVPENEWKVKTHVFAGWASESVIRSLKGIDIDAPKNEEEINKVRAALASLKKYGDEITPDGDATYTAVYLKRASVRFTPGEDGIGDDRFLSEPPVMYSNIKLLSSASFISKDGEDLCGWLDVNDNNKEYALGASYFVTKPELIFKAKWDKHIHNLTHHEAVSATCETAGNIKFWACSDCGRCFRDEACEYEVAGGDTVIDALGHNWEDPLYSWKERSEGGFTVTASMICLNDPTLSHAKTETVTVTAPSSIKEASCLKEGEKTYTAEFRDKAFETQTKTVKTEKAEHRWGEWTVDPADGTGDIRTCSVCQSTETRAHAHVHTLQAVDEAAPTCEESGIKKHWVCVGENGQQGERACGKWYADADGNQEIPGATDAERKASWKIPAKGHKLVSPSVTVINEPTCEKVGVTNIRRDCERCNFFKIETVNPPALGHNWDSGTVTKLPTCEGTGIRLVRCINDPKHVDTQTMPALGHDWGEWETVKEATETETGIRERVCPQCGGAQHEVIPAKGGRVTPAQDQTVIQAEILDGSLPKVSIKKPAKAKKAVTVRWKKLSKKKKKKVKGIEIQYSQNRDFSGAALRTAKKTKASKKIKKLESKKTYYVRARTYKYVGGVKHVSYWSRTKKVRTR